MFTTTAVKNLPVRLLHRLPLSPVLNVVPRGYSSSEPDMFIDSVKNWFQRVGRKTTLGASTALFNVCENHCAHSYWQRHAKIGDDFRSKHMLMVLHVWMVHKRLLKEEKKGLLVQESLFDQLWDDTSNRMYKKGIPEISLNKYLKEVQSYSFRTCVELDQSLDQLNLPLTELNAKKLKDLQELEPDASLTTLQSQMFKNTEEAVVDSLAGALWRGVYLRREDIDEDIVLSLARYVRSEQDRLSEMSSDVFFEGRFTFQSVVPFLTNVSAPVGIKAGSSSENSSGGIAADNSEDADISSNKTKNNSSNKSSSKQNNSRK